MSSTRNFKSPGVFAEDASTVIPPTPIAGVAYRDAVSGTDDVPNGWRYGTRVNSQDFNQVMFLMTSMLSSLDKKGILGWSDAVDYTESGMCFGSDGDLYLWLQASGPASVGAKDPVSNPLYWFNFSSTKRGYKILFRSMTAGSGNFVVPDGVYAINYKMWGGGGGGGGGGTISAGNGAGSGGYVEGWLEVEPGQSIPYTIGAAGVAGTTSGSGTSGTSGGNSSLNTTIVASGGGGGSGGTTGGGVAGVGSGGDFNATGTSGSGPVIQQGSIILAPPGGGAYGVGPSSYGYGKIPTPGRAPGGGGSGGVGTTGIERSAGGDGTPGALYIWG